MTIFEMVLRTLMLVVIVAVTFVAAVGIFYLLRWLFSEMAARNIFTTFRTEGEIKAVMKGKKCVRYVMAVENYIIDPIDYDIHKGFVSSDGTRHELQEYANFLLEKAKEQNRPQKEERKLKLEDDKYIEPAEFNDEFEAQLIRANSHRWFERIFGVVWVGLPPYRIFTYEFSWLKYAQDKDESGKPSKTARMIVRRETVYSLFFRYPVYGIVIDDVETGAGSFGLVEDIEKKPKKGAGAEPKKDNPATEESKRELQRIQLHMEFVVETRTTNPQKTLFRTAGLSSAGEWLNAISKEIRDDIRTWVGSVDYDTIVGDKKKVEYHLERLRRQLNSGILLDEEGNETKDADGKTVRSTISTIKDYGQEILKIDLVNVDLKQPELQKAIDDIFMASRAVEKAQKEMEREVLLAKGNRAKAAAPILGQADGLREIALVPNGVGVKMKVAEEIGKIKVLNLGQGAGTMLGIPDSILGETQSEKPSPTADKDKPAESDENKP